VTEALALDRDAADEEERRQRFGRSPTTSWANGPLEPFLRDDS